MITITCNYCPASITDTDVAKAIAWDKAHTCEGREAAHAAQ